MELSLYIKDKLVSGKRIAIPIMTHPGIELLGKQVSDAVTNGEIHYHAIRALNECFPQSAACTTIMDLTVEAEAFGARLSMSPNEVPSVCGRLLTGYADVEALQIPSVESGRIPQYLLADRLAAEGIDKPVLAGCIGPYSLAGRLYDMTEIMMAIYTEPDTVLLLLEKCTEFILRYCLAIKETGVAGVIMAEPAAGLLSNEDCQRYSSAHCITAKGQSSFPSYAAAIRKTASAAERKTPSASRRSVQPVPKTSPIPNTAHMSPLFAAASSTVQKTRSAI